MEWKPTPYPGGKALPPGYSGVDAKRFYELFAARTSSNKKREFETKEQFEARTADKAAMLSPISLTDSYAFRVEGIELSYDADTEAFWIVSDQWISQAFCRIATIAEMRDTYQGSNAFGVMRSISRIRAREFSLALPVAFPLGNAAVIDLFTKRDGVYQLRDQLKVPLGKANTIAKAKFGVYQPGDQAGFMPFKCPVLTESQRRLTTQSRHRC